MAFHSNPFDDGEPGLNLPSAGGRATSPSPTRPAPWTTFSNDSVAAAQAIVPVDDASKLKKDLSGPILKGVIFS